MSEIESRSAPKPSIVFATQAGRWQAVCDRAAAADGRFVYGVATTGIYCRPSCPARKPKRENAIFFDDPAMAERAGFRPCKRCKPQAPDAQLEAITAAARSIEEAETMPNLTALAASAGFSPSHFHRLFKKLTGLTPAEYGRACRAGRLRETLSGCPSVTTAMFDAGFGSASRFYAQSEEALGMTASAYRKGGDGLEIMFGFGESALGLVLVATTKRGICAVLFGEDRESLRRELASRFPRAVLLPAAGDFEQKIAAVLRMIEQPAAGHSLPLDIRGTAFQQRVWDALRDIPAGGTATYREIAAAIGSPKAVRAVGSACGANPISVLIPCHRAMRSDGSLGGYRWGLERKMALLKRESKED